ncbi:MAG: hypothetical protein H6861_09420 [Rhodospirillales bacterium]|nr:hypothetical protein [Rhodospirillales bacterium]
MRHKSIFFVLEDLLTPLFTQSQKQEKAIAARTLWSSVHGIYLMEETNKIGIIGNNPAADMANCLIDNFIAGLQRR